jgi:hypothetical protein
MRKSGAVVVLIAGLLLVSGLAGLHAQSSTRPPQNLKKVGDHWTPWDPPPAGPDAYIIVRGDTLWDLSERWLGDPFLWPQIWDENRYILDSHWIYPGDPLVIPGKPTVVPEEGPPPAEDLTEVPPEPGAAEPPTPPEPSPLIPVAETSDVYCSGYIDPEHRYSDLWVAGTEFEKEHLGQGDVIYFNHGKNIGVRPGDQYTILRETEEVRHPESSDRLGQFVRRLGWARVMLVQEDSAIAVIEFACDDVQMSDELVPWEEIPVPRFESLPEFDRYDVIPSGGQIGQIVFLPDQLVNVATGQMIHTDLGAASGVAPGSVLTLYRDQGDLPRAMIGQAVVLTVEPLTSTAKITTSVRETHVGDRVEVLR